MGKRYVVPRKFTGSVPLRLSNSAGTPFSDAITRTDQSCYFQLFMRVLLGLPTYYIHLFEVRDLDTVPVPARDLNRCDWGHDIPVAVSETVKSRAIEQKLLFSKRHRASSESSEVLRPSCKIYGSVYG